MKWKQPAIPRHVVQMFVADLTGKVLLMHRSNNVSSARNVWSIPSGTHEIGEQIACCAARELEEEYNLEMEQIQLLDIYENIGGDLDVVEQYHWVISLYMVRVHDVTVAVNREPDKHDDMKFLSLDAIRNETFLNFFQFHSSLQQVLRLKLPQYMDALEYFLWPAGRGNGIVPSIYVGE